MSQRESGYARVERDLYETPEWVTRALLPHLPAPTLSLWEPACGGMKMANVLEAAGYGVACSDISIRPSMDFLQMSGAHHTAGVVTNPPYNLAREFIEHALNEMRGNAGFVAMLLRTDFDHAATRQNLFSACQQFAKKIVLTKRIVWFERKGAAPSFNHAWYIWDWKHTGAPTLAYAPPQAQAASERLP